MRNRTKTRMRIDRAGKNPPVLMYVTVAAAALAILAGNIQFAPAFSPRPWPTTRTWVILKNGVMVSVSLHDAADEIEFAGINYSPVWEGQQ